MGIPKFFGWFANQDIFKAAVSEFQQVNPDIFAIDLNGIIHSVAGQRSGGYRAINQGGVLLFNQTDLISLWNEIARGTFTAIIDLTRIVRPTKSLIIAVDGVAPQSKINQQRNRRYKGATERKPDEIFDRNSITPGTDFMMFLDRYIRQEIERVLEIDKNPRRSHDPFAEVLPPHIVYSSHLVPGEGEHKIAEQLRIVQATGQTLAVYGADADLIMIYSMHLRNGWENIYLLRPERVTHHIEKMVNLKFLETILTQLYPGVPAPIDDFVTIMFLIGNDFLPHFPVFERAYDALTTLVGGYRQFLEQDKDVEITNGSSINWENFGRFLQFIAENYNDILLKRWGENRDAMIKFPSLVAEKCITQTRQIIGTESQCVRTFNTEKFGIEWYQFVFSPKTGKFVTPPTMEDILEITNYYLQGVAWVYSYYRYGVEAINLGWYYPYHYAPLFTDLYKLIQMSFATSGATWETNPIHLHSDFVSPLEQLVMVLPPRSLTTLPAELRLLMSESSSIYDLFPEHFLVDTQGKMEDWQSVAILPIPNPTRVIRAVLSLNLPPQFTNRYDQQENFVINRNLDRTYRISGGRSVRGRGTQYNQPRRGGGRGRGESSRGRGGSFRARGQSSGRGGFGRGQAQSAPELRSTAEYRKTLR